MKQWGIHDFIVWNEPNTRLYWSPQKDDSGTDVAAPAYEALLATCYDSIHAADPAANVIGMGLSPRASTSESTEPLVFLRDVGKAYRASGRTTPIMDQLSIHPYPNPNSPTDSPGRRLRDRRPLRHPEPRPRQAGGLRRFNGTGQPTTLNGLTFVIDEVGWQTDTTAYTQYVNPENVDVDQRADAGRLHQDDGREVLRLRPDGRRASSSSCSSTRSTATARTRTATYVGGGWQSGLLTAGGEGVSAPKASYAQVGAAFAGRPRAPAPADDLVVGTTGSSSKGGTSRRTQAGAKAPRRPAHSTKH